MKRKLIAFSMTVALLLSMIATVASAHFVEIESKLAPPKVASRGDWFGVRGDGVGSVVTQRNNLQQGEVIVRDSTRDQRLIVATEGVTRAADLDWFGVTADATNIYFLTKVERYVGITQDPPIELMISIDTNHQNGQGTLALPNTAGISVTNDAAWEYVVNTKFSKGLAGVATGATTIYTSGGSASGSSCGTSCQAQLASSAVEQGSFAEIAVPWSRIPNAKPTGANYLRFTVSSYYTNRAKPPVGSQSTAVIDVLDRSTRTNPTENAIADGQMDEGSAFDVHFDTNGGAAATYEPYSPLLITEFQPNPVGDDNPGPTNPIQTESEYIEIYNPNSFAINLADYKVGNAANRGSSKGMFKFKSGTIAAGEALIVAKSKTRFLNGWRQRHPGQPDPRVLDLTTDLQQYSSYATGTTIQLDNAPSGTQTALKEQIVLLDAKDGIVDVVSYGTSTAPYPGQVQLAIGAVEEGVSYERCPAGLDTNGGFSPRDVPATNLDFVVHAGVDAQTPGVACVGRPGVDMAIDKVGPATVQAGLTARFELVYSNVGISAETAGSKVTIADTLPAGLTFASAEGTQPVVAGNKVTWTLDAPAPGGLPQSLVYTATVSAALAPNTQLTNNVTIASPNELTDATTQLNNADSWTVQIVGPAQPAISLSGLSKTPPGRQFTMQINYSNVGASDLLDGKVTLNIPAGVTLISATAPGATANFTGQQVGPKAVSWTLDGDLPSQQSGAITVVGLVSAGLQRGTQLQFSASMTSTSPNAVAANATGTLVAEPSTLFIPITRKP